MNNFIIYSIEIAISLALFYSAYWVFLKKETFFKLNRFYILASVVISLATPLLNINTVPGAGSNSFISNYLILPVERFEQSIRVRFNTDNNSLINEPGTAINGPNTLSRKTSRLHDARDGVSNPAQSLSLNSAETTNTVKKTNWLTVLAVLYFVGVVLFFIRFVANFIWIFNYALKHKTQTISGMKVIRLQKNISPFSFLNYIFIGTKDYPETELAKIISHEKVHIRQKHSIDLILFELVFVFQWFNPFVWFYKRALKITHEYLADFGTLNTGVDVSAYQYSLLNEALCENNFEIASPYNLSLKKRITMMMKKRSSALSALKLTVALPIVAFLFIAFAFNSKAPASNISKEQSLNSLFVKDSAIKKVELPLSYLKSLEGVYISNNEGKRKRKIRFELVLGSLIGNDGGYIYRIIPVGDENFVNPDDNASLVFNSKDKQHITLQMFGVVNLDRIEKAQEVLEFPKNSLAFSTTNIMFKDGIEAGLTYYNQNKTSPAFELNENEMNYAGYLFLQTGKLLEAKVLFRLNVDEFPASWNVYDSYAESLMALGEKQASIENYKKSLELNPGSKSGFENLKKLGVNTDGLVKKINLPVAYLKSLEGEYHSTNQPNNWVRKIRFYEENGVLNGIDNGYHYKLLPVGGEKFINPDDGASLVFNSSNKEAMSLLLFGSINLVKVKPSEETTPKAEKDIKKIDLPLAYLQQLVGEYVTDKSEAVPRTITFTLENGILYGKDRTYRYKIIPIAEGSFVNPDDGASLVFDSKDKNAISLLLFGKIHLKKVN